MAKKPKTSKVASRLSLLALAPRRVFDGAIPVTDPSLLDPNQGLKPNATSEAAAKATANEVPAAREVAAKREIVFVDDLLAEVDGFLSSLNTQLAAPFQKWRLHLCH